MRTARDITFNEAELANNINIKNLFKITTPITTTTDDSDLIISEIIKVITQKSSKSITLVNIMMPPRDLNKIYKNIINNPPPILIAIYTNTTIDKDD